MDVLYSALAHINYMLGRGFDIFGASTMTQVGLGALIASALGAIGLMATRHLRN